MARIPDVQSLGGRSLPQPSRGVASISAASPTGDLAQSVGGQMVQAAERTFTRQDALSRARLSTQFDREAQDELRRITDEEDITSLETVKKYGAWVKNKQAEIIGQHQGSEDSRSALGIRLTERAAEYAGEIGGRSYAAQQAMVDEAIGNSLKPIIGRAYDDPGAFDDSVGRIDDELNEMKGALSPEKEMSYRSGALGQLAGSTIDGMLDRGDLDGAEAFLQRPDVSQLLDANAQRAVRARVSAFRREEDKWVNDALGKVAAFRAVYGRQPNETERNQIMGLGGTGNDRLIAVDDGQGGSVFVRESEAAGRRPPQQNSMADLPVGYQWVQGPNGPQAMAIPGTPQAAEQQQAQRDARAKQIAGESGDMQQGRAVLQSVNRVFDAMGTGITNGVGPIEGSGFFSWIPGTNTRQIELQLEGIKANVGFDRLQAMRDASPTGGALGQVTERELSRLEASAGALSTELDEAVFADRMVEVGESYARIMFGSDEELQLAVEMGDMTPAQAMAAAEARDGEVDKLRERADEMKGIAKIKRDSSEAVSKRFDDMLSAISSGEQVELSRQDIAGFSDEQIKKLRDAWDAAQSGESEADGGQ